ncbi:hypothetical protein GGR54DRAFT_509505 [Hypoxylon sp. NC1633]|nr:hypothetical protein GGR54DRAFT_509505 [Hypoxylon sp. NC1633]
MGRPLWIEPVESDIPAKSAPKSPADPANGRTPINRRHGRATARRSSYHMGGMASTTSPHTRRQQLRDVREHRLRMLTALQRDEDNNPLSTTRRTPSLGLNETQQYDPLTMILRRHAAGSDEDPELSPELAALIRRPGRTPLDEAWEEQMAQVDGVRENTATQPREDDQAEHEARGSATRDEPYDLADSFDIRRFTNVEPIGVSFGIDVDAIERIRAASMIEDSRLSREDAAIARTRRATANVARLQQQPDRNRNQSASHRSRDGESRAGSSSEMPLAEEVPRHFQEAYRDYRRRREGIDERRHPPNGVRRRPRGRYVDGLGDRDRSLSPDLDMTWETLWTTLTPDPQPPSVGSSFASTTASTVASQNPATVSSRTSMNSAWEQGPDPPCDPVNESDSHTEGSEDVEIQRTGSERSWLPVPHGRRSYAEVAADPNHGADPDHDADPVPANRHWLSGMHRIVRGLASRQDIPDEWWAQAGLSRSMPWEESN